MNFPTEVVTPKEIAHYLLFTRWHHFWGQIRTWDKSEKNQAEAELADALESYAESFRAETLARAAEAKEHLNALDSERAKLESGK